LLWVGAGFRFSVAIEISLRHQQLFVSIIIAVRNEEKNIATCLSDLLNQDFPHANFEIIVVDDHSVDSTIR
jgi:glycosyltransferase involved in cell wall biosynthesis